MKTLVEGNREEREGSWLSEHAQKRWLGFESVFA